MTDLLAERMESLVNRHDQGDWLDVRRRARRRTRRVAVPAAAAAVALVAAAALAASGGWIFTSHDNTVLASAQVEFHGHTYTVRVLASHARTFSLLLLRKNRPVWTFVVARANGRPINAAPGQPQFIPPSGPALGTLVGAFSQGDGQLWFGDARQTVASIAITDTHNNVFTTQTAAAPPGTKLAFRFWIVALPHSKASTIASYDATGHLVDRGSIWGH